MYYFIIIIVIFLLLGYIVQYITMNILLGYSPAKYTFKTINNEIRIYHNGLSKEQCIDEGDTTMTFYTIPPKYVKFIFWNNDNYLDKWQQHAQLWKS